MEWAELAGANTLCLVSTPVCLGPRREVDRVSRGMREADEDRLLNDEDGRSSSHPKT